MDDTGGHLELISSRLRLAVRVFSMKKIPALILLSLLVLTGCSSGSSAPAAGASAAAGGDYSLPDSAPLPADANGTAAPGGSAELSPQIVRTAQVALRVPELLPAVARLRLLASSHQGQVTSEQLTLEEGGSATSSFVVIEVAAAELDDSLAAIGELGDVLSRQVSADDVTTQVADLDARLRNLDASIARLTKLMDRAGNLADLTSLEEQLTARQGDRDSLAAQQKALAGQVARSTITVSLETPDQVVTAATPGFLGGLQAGWDGLIKTLAVGATLLGMLLPFVAVLALVLVPVVWWRHRRNQRREIADPVAAGASPAAATETPSPTSGQTEQTASVEADAPASADGSASDRS